MKFIVERDDLVDAVNWVARSLSTRPIKPELLGILIDVDTSITLTGSDLETSTKAILKADISVKGKVLVPGRLLAEIARALPNKPITFTLDGNRVLVTAGASKFTLPTLATTEYPSLPTIPETVGVVDSDAFSTAVNQVAFAAARDETIIRFTGVHMELTGNTMTLAATDKYRIAVKEIAWQSKNEIDTSILLRARTLSEAVKSLTSAPHIAFALTQGTSVDRLVGFVSDLKTMTTRTLTEEFSAYKKLFEFDPAATITIEVDVLLNAVKRVALVTDKTVPLRLNFTEGILRLEAGADQDAQATEELEIEYIGDPISVGFNPVYLAEGLQALGHKFAEIRFFPEAQNPQTADARKQVILIGKEKADGEVDKSYKYAIMPMRYNS
jgi:DNA polymerase-3 subunit beta